MIRLSPIKVLCIDDNELMMKLYRHMFAGFFGGNYFVMKGCEGVEAFNGIKVHNYDIILVDYQYSQADFNGEDVEKHLREEKKYQGAIVFVTARDDIVIELLKKGKLAVSKPIDIDKMRQLCIKLVNKECHGTLLEDISNYDVKKIKPKF